jgi:sugar lactone lactonase YvrE
MKEGMKNWVWFLLLMVLILGIGFFVGNNRRAELGKSFDYSLDDFRKVDAALIKYKETMQLDMGLGEQKPGALAVDDAGTLYVTGYNSIFILTSLLGKPREMKIDDRPNCIAVDDEGMIFLGVRDRIDVYSASGEKLDSWTIPSNKAHLTSIAVDIRYVYAADAGSRRIWRYDRKNPEQPLEIGEKDWANGVRGFNVPSPSFDVAVSRADGSIWAVNPGFHALENYRSDGMPLSSWEASSMTIEGFSGCCNPAHFALLPDGGFVTAEKGLPRVKIHNVNGSLRCVVAASDQFDDDAHGLDVAVGADGRIFVLDPGRNQVRVFEEIK